MLSAGGKEKMFSKMINQLQEGRIPPAEDLASLLKVALVKKQGVLQQPPACWSNDPKINPDAVHLLWAATLLGHEDEILTAAGVMINELLAGPRKADPGQELSTVNEKLMEIVGLAPTRAFRLFLKERADQACKVVSQFNA